jgi:predicted ATPase
VVASSRADGGQPRRDRKGSDLRISEVLELTLKRYPRFNILVGENEAGKSTLLEAIGLALT